MKAVLFDMDGVLVDTVGMNWRAYNQVLKEDYGFVVPPTGISRYVGKSLDTQVMELRKDFGVDIDLDTFRDKTAQLKAHYMERLTPMAGARELVRTLTMAGVLTAVGTSNSRQVTESRLQKVGLLGLFDAIVAEEDIEYHKPAPDTYLACATLLGLTPTECVVVEDAPSGVQAGLAANMKVIAVETPYVAIADLQDANRVVLSLADLDVSAFERL